MLEVGTKKQRISLLDFNYKRDVDTRLLMSSFSRFDLEVLEEILFSPLKFSLSRLIKDLSTTKEKIASILSKLEEIKLLKIQNDEITVDKDLRKYFESHVEKFDTRFVLGVEYFLSLLHQIPIHLLPMWYSISRTSNHIVESVIERYLQTPQLYQRYLLELNFDDPILESIFSDLKHASNDYLSAKEIMEKHTLTHEEFQEKALLLELNFVGCLGYEEADDHWNEVIKPFYEWDQYQTFLKNRKPKKIDSALINVYKTRDFAFIKDLEQAVLLIQKDPQSTVLTPDGTIALKEPSYNLLISSCPEMEKEDPYLPEYIEHLLLAAQLLHFINIEKKKISLSPNAEEWLDLGLEEKAHFFYRHGISFFQHVLPPSEPFTERQIREVEKSLEFLDTSWTLFDDTLQMLNASLTITSTVELKKEGRSWHYALPKYTNEEKKFIHSTIFHWLFYVGAISIGKYSDKPCFTLTSFGKTLLSG